MTGIKDEKHVVLFSHYYNATLYSRHRKLERIESLVYDHIPQCYTDNP